MADFATDLNLPSAPRDMPLRPFRPEDLPALYKMIDLYLPQVTARNLLFAPARPLGNRAGVGGG